MTVDAVMGTIAAHAPFIARCFGTLKEQVERVIIVADGWGLTLDDMLPLVNRPPITLLKREHQHSPGASFNYGAAKAVEPWLLYVDPHTLFKEDAVAFMLGFADEHEYDVVFGTGRHYPLANESPWVHALGPTVNRWRGPFTFLMRRRLWEQLGGIPEPRQGHMDALMGQLRSRGVVAGWVENMCLHCSEGDWLSVVRDFFMAGKCYAELDVQGVSVPGTTDRVQRLRGVLTTAKIQTLWSLILNSAYQLGVVDGYALHPQEPQRVPLRFEWLPPEKEEEP